jgi:hypothetical protein
VIISINFSLFSGDHIGFGLSSELLDFAEFESKFEHLLQSLIPGQVDFVSLVLFEIDSDGHSNRPSAALPKNDSGAVLVQEPGSLVLADRFINRIFVLVNISGDVWVVFLN